MKRRGAIHHVKCFLQYVIVQAVAFLVRLAPDEAAGFVGCVFGNVTWVLDRRHRLQAEKNLAAAFGDVKDMRAVKRLARRSIVHAVTVMVEMLKFPRVFTRRRWRRYVRFRIFDGIAEARAKGRGIIFVTGHLGNWEASAQAMAMTGFPVHSVYRALDNPYLDRLVRKSRERGGIRAVERRGGIRTMLRVLKRGGYLGLVVDQDTKEDPVFVRFFGQPAAMVKTPALLALRTGATIIPGFAPRTGGPFRYDMYAGPPIPVADTGDMERDVRETSQNIAAVFEQYIRKYPEQWLWAHNRWKTRPSDMERETP